MIIGLSETKEFLRVTHSLDDSLITRLIAQVEQEAETYLGANIAAVSASSSSEPITEDVKTALLILVQRLYDGDIKDFDTFTMAAKQILGPLRCNLGF